MENLLDQASEEEHLRAIWRDLGVGKSGSLTISELAVVCEHIGMEEMDEEVREAWKQSEVKSHGKNVTGKKVSKESQVIKS